MIVNINKDTHRVLINRLDKQEVKTHIVWKSKEEYCLDTDSYDDYCKAKQIQIKMMNEGFENVPVV